MNCTLPLWFISSRKTIRIRIRRGFFAILDTSGYDE
jgi:hypothetical protein